MNESVTFLPPIRGQCQYCHGPIPPERRSHTKTCSDAHRQALSRLNKAGYRVVGTRISAPKRRVEILVTMAPDEGRTPWGRWERLTAE